MSVDAVGDDNGERFSQKDTVITKVSYFIRTRTF